MAVSVSTEIFAKGSVELQLAKVSISLGIVFCAAIIIGLWLHVTGWSDHYSTTSFGVALLAGVANLYALAILSAILYFENRNP